MQPWRYVWGSHGDALGNAYEYTWAAAMLHAGRPLTVNQQTAWPFGDALGSTPHDPLFWWFTIGLSYLIGAIPALNLLSLLAIPLATWAMYRLALRITRHSAASLVAGVAFGCSTYLLQNSRGEPTLVQAWVFPVEALALVSVMARPRLLTVVAAGLATALAASVDFYYALFAAIVAVVLSGTWSVITLLEARRVPVRSLLGVAAAGAIALVAAGALYVGTFGDLKAQAGQIRRPANQLAVLAVMPLDFVLPPRYNPWFGEPRMQLVAKRLQRTGNLVDLAEVEQPLAVLVLAPLGLVLFLVAVVRRRARHRIAELGALVGVALAGLWLMVPPDASDVQAMLARSDLLELLAERGFVVARDLFAADEIAALAAECQRSWQDGAFREAGEILSLLLLGPE